MTITFRRLGIEDLEELMDWRVEVLQTVFDLKEVDTTLIAANKAYYQSHLCDGRHIPLIASVDGMPAACGAICFQDEIPSPDNPSGKNAYLMNIYCRPAFRQHGVARDLVEKLIEIAKAQGAGKIYLETTKEGRPVYTSCGFGDYPDMMKLKSAQ